MTESEKSRCGPWQRDQDVDYHSLHSAPLTSPASHGNPVLLLALQNNIASPAEPIGHWQAGQITAYILALSVAFVLQSSPLAA